MLLKGAVLIGLALAAAPADAFFHPHYVSQRAGEASLREGPGYGYKILWVYRHKHYPFKESASFDIWRRVTAPDGAVGWMSSQMLSESRSVVVTGKARAQIRENEKPDAKVIGLADPGAVMGLKACALDACRVYADGLDGWISKNRIWGVEQDEAFK